MAPIRQPKGWTVPGYNYLGPFNPLKNGKPVNKADRAAQRHDRAYDRYINSGKNPYLYFNKADQDFINELENDSSFGGILGKAAFKVKKAIAPTLGGEDKPGPSKKKDEAREGRRATAAFKRKLWFAKAKRGDFGKKLKMDAGGEPDPEEQPQSSSAEPRAGGGGGGGPGGAGVGISTGGWVGGCLFGQNKVVTTVTRQWYVPIYNSHKYTKITGGTGSGQNRSAWEGIATPWGYFNFNAYYSHFSPQDWQRLTNEYKRWRPRKMRVQLYNLQIKQIVLSGADTLYNNDLTAGVHVFCDGSHQYPYAQHPWDEQNLPELPNEVYKLPQYSYYQMNTELVDSAQGGNQMEQWIRKSAPLFMLETSSHEVLRTGEETSFEFDFECGWVHNDRAFCPPQADFNPLVKSRRYYPKWTGTTFQFSRYNPYHKPSNWMPGPGMRYTGDYRNNTDIKSVGPIISVQQPPGTTSSYAAQQSKFGVEQPTNNMYEIEGNATAPVNGACASLDYPNLAFESGGAEADNLVGVVNIDTDMNRWGATATVYSNNFTSGVGNANYATQDAIWMYPMQTWNGTPICRNNPIWDKKPNADYSTIDASSDGTLPMSHPPGTIFVKVAKIPIPTEQNTDSYLNIYCTGQVSCEIEWEVERYQTKNWRPELRTSAATFTDSTMYNFDANGAYNQSEDFGETMPTKLGMSRIN